MSALLRCQRRGRKRHTQASSSPTTRIAEEGPARQRRRVGREARGAEVLEREDRREPGDEHGREEEQAHRVAAREREQLAAAAGEHRSVRPRGPVPSGRLGVSAGCVVRRDLAPRELLGDEPAQRPCRRRGP